MDLDLVRAFVVTAEEENVGRAAERLHVTQSPLSRQIQKLEAQLGLPLFHRVRKRLRITAEGRRFLVHAQGLLAHAEEVVAAARRLAQGADVPVEIGYVEAALHSGVLPAALRRFGAGGAGVRLHRLRSGAQADGVESGRLDIGLVHQVPETNVLASHKLAELGFLLALPSDHPAGAGTLCPAMLDGAPWIALDRAANPDFRAVFLKACDDCGFRPDIRYQTTDVQTALALVASGLGCALIDEGLAAWGVPPAVTLRRLPQFPLTIPIHALWRKDCQSPGVARLRRALCVPAAT